MRRFLSAVLVMSLLLCGCSSGGSKRDSDRRSGSHDSGGDSGFNRPDPTEATEGTSATQAPADVEEPEVFTFTLQPIAWDTATLGQVAVPEGYTASSQINCCDETTCLGYPLRVTEAVTNADGSVMMLYKCGEQYIERVSGNTIMSMQDGAMDTQTMIFMKYYEEAPAYCDELAATLDPNAVYVRDEDMSFYDSVLDARYQEFYNTIAPGLEAYGMSVDWVNMTASQRLYSIPNDQVGEYALCILAEVRGYQYTISGYGFTDTIIVWDVPGYYILICPMADYEEYHDTMFQVFIDNTTTNDQFVSCNEQLTAEITNTVINNMNMVCAASSAYASAMTAMTFDMVESNMNYGTYSSDRFSDYIFDQNDYTLSDGTSVQISTQYDYVYQGDNGVVYYSDSAFDVPPVGATQLYPN